MTLPDSTETRDEKARGNRAPSIAELDVSRPDKTGGPGSNPVSLGGRRLDVDAVLERSMRKVVTPD